MLKFYGQFLNFLIYLFSINKLTCDLVPALNEIDINSKNLFKRCQHFLGKVVVVSEDDAVFRETLGKFYLPVFTCFVFCSYGFYFMFDYNLGMK